MMKPRSNRSANLEQAAISSRSKVDGPAGGNVQLNQAQTSAQVIRKRRSSINVYDQPSSLNSRLRQLETDMLRLDEDRSKLYDDTHSALAQYELKLNEIHAILKSRQDNVDKYVEDMRLLLAAKEEFERQAKLLHEKHDRIHEKFMHRETTISREIKLLKNKFELLEKSRQFRTLLQKSTSNMSMGDIHNHAASGLDDSLAAAASGAASSADSPADAMGSRDPNEADSLNSGVGGGGPVGRRASQLLRLGAARGEAGVKTVRIKLAKLNPVRRLLQPLLNRLGLSGGGGGSGPKRRKGSQRGPMRRKSNRVASVAPSLAEEEPDVVAAAAVAEAPPAVAPS